MVSTTTAPPSSPGRMLAATVISGSRLLRESVAVNDGLLSFNPLARAVRT